MLTDQTLSIRFKTGRTLQRDGLFRLFLGAAVTMKALSLESCSLGKVSALSMTQTQRNGPLRFGLGLRPRRPI